MESAQSRKRSLPPKMSEKMKIHQNPHTLHPIGFNPRINPTIAQAVENLFNKRYEFVNADNYILPAPDVMFTGSTWQIPELQALKLELNKTKSLLNDVSLTEWQNHTRRRNPAGEVQWRLRREISPEFLTQAWCKFYENVCSFPLISQSTLDSKRLHSLHLCEAPGAFITSLNHYLKTHHSDITWTWTATTLNPHHEGNSLSTMINDDRLILHTSENWCFGADNTGDLMLLENFRSLVEVAKNRSQGDIMLITADGSISCLDQPDEQESVVVQLHYCETVTALHLLGVGGSFLLKVFTVFEHETVCLLYLLRCCFERIVLNKPATSKEGNSEVYVICMGFKGLQTYLGKLEEEYEGTEVPIFRREDLPEGFVQQVVEAGTFFKDIQCGVIEGNLRSFGEEWYDLKSLRKAVAQRFIEGYGVERLRTGMELVGKRVLEVFSCEVMAVRFREGSYNDRQRKMDGREKITGIWEDMCDVSQEGEFQFQLRGDPGALKITLGKKYQKVQSSRFCIAKILKDFILSFHVMAELGLKIEFPKAEAKTQFIEEMKKRNTQVYCFEYSANVDSNLVVQIYEIIEKIEESESIVLLGFSLLSQLNVGILYLLSYGFETLKMTFMNDLGVVVTLENARGIKGIVHSFREITEASENAGNSDNAVISIFPIAKLCVCELYHSILTINHGAIKNVISHMIEKINASQ